MAFSDSAQRGIVGTFLAYTDGVAALEDVLLVGATNYPDLIDPAALRPGRFDKLIYVSAPDAVARRAIFATYLRGKPLSPDLDFNALASLTDGYSSADIASLCNAAAVQAAKETIRTGVRQPISTQWLQPLIARTPASIKPEDLAVYENFRAR